MTLMSLKDDYLKLLWLGDSDDPDEHQAFLDTLDGIVGEIEVKADAYAAVVEDFESSAKRCREEAKRLMERAKRYETQVKTMKDRLMGVMLATDRPVIKTDLHTFTVCKNGGDLPIEYTGDIPDQFMRVVYEKDTDLIKQTLKAGHKLDFAHFGERGTHLRIK